RRGAAAARARCADHAGGAHAAARGAGRAVGRGAVGDRSAPGPRARPGAEVDLSTGAVGGRRPGRVRNERDRRVGDGAIRRSVLMVRLESVTFTSGDGETSVPSYLATPDHAG